MVEKQFQTNMFLFLRKLAIVTVNYNTNMELILYSKERSLPMFSLVLETTRFLETDDLSVLETIREM